MRHWVCLRPLVLKEFNEITRKTVQGLRADKERRTIQYRDGISRAELESIVRRRFLQLPSTKQSVGEALFAARVPRGRGEHGGARGGRSNRGGHGGNGGGHGGNGDGRGGYRGSVGGETTNNTSPGSANTEKAQSSASTEDLRERCLRDK